MLALNADAIGKPPCLLPHLQIFQYEGHMIGQRGKGGGRLFDHVLGDAGQDRLDGQGGKVPVHHHTVLHRTGMLSGNSIANRLIIHICIELLAVEYSNLQSHFSGISWENDNLQTMGRYSYNLKYQQNRTTLDMITLSSKNLS